MSKAIVVTNEKNKYQTEIKDLSFNSLSEGEVLIKSSYSSINYKDALAVTGKGKILRSFPLVPGIDVCGTVIESKSKKFKSGDRVFQTGGNLGETYNGGLSEKVLLSDENCLLSPAGLTDEELITMGTAGLTAGLAVYKMELNNLDKSYPVLVTGASGGVGSFAVQILSQKEYSVTAMTGKPEAAEWLKNIGATEVVSPNSVNMKSKALESVKWSGCVDNVGGELLKNIIPHINIYGQVASIGLAGGHKLETTVMPFILRGVNLLGVSSNNCPMNIRKLIWKSLSENIKPKYLKPSHTINLDQVAEYSNKLLDRKIKGRIIVKLKGA